MAHAVGATPKWRLIPHILALSEEQSWPAATAEWKTRRIEVLREPDSKTCICTKKRIHQVWHIVNKRNANRAIVGNCCIKKFTSNPHFTNKHRILNCFKKLKKGEAKSINSELMKYVRRKKFVSAAERKRYNAIRRPKSPTITEEKEAFHKRVIEQIMLNGANKASKSKKSSLRELEQDSVLPMDRTHLNLATPASLSDTEAPDTALLYQTPLPTSRKAHLGAPEVLGPDFRILPESPFSLCDEPATLSATPLPALSRAMPNSSRAVPRQMPRPYERPQVTTPSTDLSDSDGEASSRTARLVNAVGPRAFCTSPAALQQKPSPLGRELTQSHVTPAPHLLPSGVRPLHANVARPLLFGNPSVFQVGPSPLAIPLPEPSTALLPQSFQTTASQLHAVGIDSLRTDFTKLERDPTSLASRALVQKGIDHNLFNDASKKFYLERLQFASGLRTNSLSEKQQKWINDLNQKILRNLRNKLN